MEVGGGGQFSASQSDSVVALGTGATANLVCYKWFANHNLYSGRRELEKAVPHPSSARFKFGDGRIGGVKHAADNRVGIAGCKGACAAFLLDAEIPAWLRKGALEALGAQLDFEKDTLSPLRHGVREPLRVNAEGQYIVRAVEFGRGPNVTASYFERSVVEKRPDLSDGGLHLRLAESESIRFAPPREFPACTAVTLGDAQDDSISDPKKLITKLRTN